MFRNGISEKSNHFTLSQRLQKGDLEDISYESLNRFLNYLYSNALDNLRDFEVLINTLHREAADCGLGAHIYVDVKFENHTPNQKGFVEIRLYNIKFSQPGEKLDSTLSDKRIFFANNHSILGIRFFLDNIFFDDSESPLGGSLNIGIYSQQKHHSTISINNCRFSAVGLSTASFNEVEIANSASIFPLVIGERTNQCIISNSSIGKIAVTGDQLIYLRIINSDISSIEERFFIEKLGKLKFLLFDYKSNVHKNAYATYKNLRMFAEMQNDKIQAFSLYKKELYSFSNEGVADLDSKILLFFNRITNANGTSIFLPIFWLFGLNTAFIIMILLNEKCLLDTGYLFHFMNVIPTISVTDETFKSSSQALDSFRRLTCGVFIFLTISSALRFRYKI